MRSRPHQHGHGLFWPVFQGAGNPIGHGIRFGRFRLGTAVFALSQEGNHFHRWFPPRHVSPAPVMGASLMSFGSAESHGAGLHVLLLRKDRVKRAIHPIHQRGAGTEVDRERDRFEAQRAHPLPAHPQEQAHFRLTEAVDGLHGVSHQKQGPGAISGPTGDNAGEKLVLAPRGILKFVHEQMAQAIIREGSLCRVSSPQGV